MPGDSTRQDRARQGAGRQGWSAAVPLRAVVIALVALAAAPAAAEEAALVEVDAVRSAPVRQTVPVIGRLVACRSGIVAARVPGAVTEMRVEVGDRVAKGTVLAVLDRDFVTAERDIRAARVSQARAAIASAAAALQLRRQELERLRGLRRSPAFSESRYEDKRQEVLIAEGDLAARKAALATAEAELRYAELSVRDAEIRAPYRGVVTRRHSELGARLERGDPVVSLVDDSCLEIEADVAAARISGLAPGARIGFDLQGRRLGARVRAVVPEENPLTRTRTVRFVPDLEGFSGLAAGQSVTLHLPAGAERMVLSVHKDAVLTRGGGKVVFVVAAGKAELRPVRLGEALGHRLRVLSGVEAGELAVVRGNERLRAGQAVRYRPVGAADRSGDRAPGTGEAGG